MNWEPWLETANDAVLKQSGRELNDVEVAILIGASQGLTYGKIADKNSYAISYLERDIGPKLWRLLSKALGRKVSKTSFRSAIERYQSELETDSATPSSAESALGPPSGEPSVTVDLLEAPCPPAFYGREAELATLNSWLLGTDAQAGCRLVTLLGIGGIGKTSFAAKLVHQVKEQFDRVIWRSVSNAPSLESLLQDLIPFLSNGKVLAPTPRQFLLQLQASRCLVILDNVESLLQPDLAGQWRPGYEAYGELLRQIGSLNHQSCILLTSREKPVDIAQIEGPSQPVRSLALTGLGKASLEFLEAEGISGTPEQFSELVKAYGGNPLALKIVSASIRDIFEGSVGNFLACDTILFNGLRRLLDEQFDRLSSLEKGVMYWLGINREWTTVRSLQTDLVPTATMDEVLEALEQLRWRSLVETEAGRYSLQPVVMEYVTSRLVKEAIQELSSGNFSLLAQHALFKTTVKDYVGDSQWRLFVQPVAQELQRNFTTTASLTSQMQSLLDTLRQGGLGNPGYAAGNLLNIALELSLDLSHYDFSNLSLAHGNFQAYDVQGLNLAATNLSNAQFTDHFGSVLYAKFSPDSQFLASSDTQGSVYIRRVRDGQIVHILQGHQSWAREMSFSSNGKKLVTASHDRTIKLWDLETGLCLKTFMGHQEIIGQAAWNPVEDIIASGSFDQTIKLWDPNTGKCLKTLTGGALEVGHLEWSEDGKRLVSCDGGNRAVIWDIATGEVVQSFEGHEAQVTYISQNQDGTLVVTASQDGSLKIWDVNTGNCLNTLRGNFPPSYSAVFHPNASLIASACFDGTIRLWNWHSGQCISVLIGHQSIVWCVCFSPDGQYLVSTSDDRSVRLWDVASNHCLTTWQGYVGSIWSLAANSNGEIASGSQEGNIHLWDCDTTQLTAKLIGHNNLIWALAWQPQGDFLASASGDYKLSIWNAKSREQVRFITDHQSALQALAWHPQGEHIASGSVQGIVKVHDFRSGECLRTLQLSNYIYALAYHPDGNYLVAGTQDGKIYIWSNDVIGSDFPETQSDCLAILEGHKASVWSIAWNPDCSRFASGSHDGTVRIWQGEIWQEQTCLNALQGHESLIWCIAWSPDGKLLVSGSQDGTARIWDVQTGQCLQVFQHDGWIRTVVWLADGDVIVAAGGSGEIYFWNVRLGECIQRLRAQRPYEGTNIFQATGISAAQRASLLALGAIEQPL